MEVEISQKFGKVIKRMYRGANIFGPQELKNGKYE